MSRIYAIAFLVMGNHRAFQYRHLTICKIKIATYGKNWSEIFEKHYTKPGEEKISGGKDAKTSWMQKLERIRNQNFHSYSVKEEEYDFLCELNEWLIEKKVDNEYA